MLLLNFIKSVKMCGHPQLANLQVNVCVHLKKCSVNSSGWSYAQMLPLLGLLLAFTYLKIKIKKISFPLLLFASILFAFIQHREIKCLKCLLCCLVAGFCCSFAFNFCNTVVSNVKYLLLQVWRLFSVISNGHPHYASVVSTQLEMLGRANPPWDTQPSHHLLEFCPQVFTSAFFQR